jgi:hypothetical protein
VLRQDTHEITVIIDGANTGVWDKLSGGEVDSEETKYKPGGMAPEVSLGGSVSIGNVTVDRGYDPLRDDVHALAARVGKADVTVIAKPLDQDRNPFGRPRTYQGKLKALTPPDIDADGGNEVARVAIEISCGGGIA